MFNDDLYPNRIHDTDGDGVIAYDASFVNASREYTYGFEAYYQTQGEVQPSSLSYSFYRIKAPNVKEAARFLRLIMINERRILESAHCLLIM